MDDLGIKYTERSLDPVDWLSYLSKGENFSNLIVTHRPMSLVYALRTVFEKLEEMHVQILTLNEEDKQGSIFEFYLISTGKWMDKMAASKKSGDWLIVRLDSFWISKLTGLLSASLNPDYRYRFWIICPEYLESELTLPAIYNCAISCDLIDKSPRYIIINAHLDKEIF